MTQENKNSLLKDLCARMPYGVNVLTDIDKTFDSGCIGIVTKIEPYVGDKFPELKGKYLLYEKGCLTPLVVDEVKPYLRPMSSMTEDEKKHLQLLHNIISDENYGDGYSPCAWDTIAEWVDYCNTHHLDYRGLIKKGLALEAPKGMYEETKED